MKPRPSFFLKPLLVLLIGSATLAVPLHAQDDAAVTVRIPFAFIVGPRSLAAGTYRFDLVSQILLSVTDVKTGHEEVFLVRPDRQRAYEPHGHLVFRTSEGRRTLNEVHFPGDNTFSDVIQQRRTRTMEAKKSPACTPMTVAQRCLPSRQTAGPVPEAHR